VLYGENCAVCHGPNGEGRVGATLAKDWPSIRPDLSIKTVIQNGVSGSPMPAWSIEKGGPLDEGEINDIVAYVVSLPAANPPAERPESATAAEPPLGPAWLQGVVGVVIFLVVLIVVVGGILLFQKRT
jgi:mono/diheme cytochrome c family protein